MKRNNCLCTKKMLYLIGLIDSITLSWEYCSVSRNSNKNRVIAFFVHVYFYVYTMVILM